MAIIHEYKYIRIIGRAHIYQYTYIVSVLALATFPFDTHC
jgi:hypothetical protein